LRPTSLSAPLHHPSIAYTPPIIHIYAIQKRFRGVYTACEILLQSVEIHLHLPKANSISLKSKDQKDQHGFAGIKPDQIPADAINSIFTTRRACCCAMVLTLYDPGRDLFFGMDPIVNTTGQFIQAHCAPQQNGLFCRR
jgi:hypothetical protein